MQPGTLFLAGLVSALAGTLPLALPGAASDPIADGPLSPAVVRLEPAPFDHRLDGEC